jgi:tRNA dimethylallyltransferase
MKQRVIVILGQTATGKSDLAVKIANKFNGEIISADSRQVYKGLDIGTGKIISKEMKGIPHYLLDVVNPRHKFTVTEYKLLAENKIKDILARKKIPIICGGTGFYIDAITQGIIFPEVPPNPKIRKDLEKRSTIELFEILQNLDKERSENIDVKNKVRLMRAIEIAIKLGKVPSLSIKKSPYKFIKIGLNLPQIQLDKKIEKRVRGMFEKGLLNEIKKLKKQGVSKKRFREFGFEYFNPTEKKVITSTIQYAKKQMTWFKRDKQIKWFKPNEYKEILNFLAEDLKDKR